MIFIQQIIEHFLFPAGKKKDMMSMFQSRTALEKQADKLSAKQEELNIKSTGEGLEMILVKILSEMLMKENSILKYFSREK